MEVMSYNRSTRIHTVLVKLVNIEVWIVAVSVGISVVFPRFLPITLALQAIFWPMRFLVDGRLSRRTPADFAVLLFVFLVPVTLWATAFPDVTTLQVMRLLSGIGLYYAIINCVNSKRHLSWLVNLLILSGVFLAGYAVISVRWKVGRLNIIPMEIYSRLAPLIEDVVHPNVMAGSLLLILPLGFALLLFGWRKFSWIYWIGIFLAVSMMTVVLILTKARAAWMSIIIVLLMISYMRWRKVWLIFFAGLTVSGVIIFSRKMDFVADIINANQAFGGIEGRFDIWSSAVRMIRDYPFTGIGLGTFGNIADMLYPFYLAAPGSTPHAHNLLLQISVDLGIPGLVAWVSIFGLISIVSWRFYIEGVSRGNYYLSGIGSGLLGSQIAIIIQGLFDSVTWGMVRPAPLVWYLWGLAIACGWIFIWGGDLNSAQLITQDSENHQYMV
jgi:putative inorganic carbon (HCO3(-)) transporter